LFKKPFSANPPKPEDKISLDYSFNHGGAPHCIGSLHNHGGATHCIVNNHGGATHCDAGSINDVYADIFFKQQELGDLIKQAPPAMRISKAQKKLAELMKKQHAVAVNGPTGTTYAVVYLSDDKTAACVNFRTYDYAIAIRFDVKAVPLLTSALLEVAQHASAEQGND
jgi:hypothetical protein